MKRFLILTALALTANAANITELFNSIEKIPESKIDKLTVKEMKINEKTIAYSAYPKLSLFASAEHFNDYISLKPLTPTQSAELLMQNRSLPFSQNVEKIGFNFNMPLFVKEIYDNKKKMVYLIKATKYQALINTLNRQTLLVTNLSKLNYLFSLKQALIKKENSIKTTKKAVEVGVKSGRVPEFQLMRLNDALNEIKIQISNINTEIEKTKEDIYALTLKKINSPIKLEAYEVKKGEFFLIKPLKEKLKASKYDIKAKKDKFLPKVMLEVKGNRAFGKAYNTKEPIAVNTASAGIYINWEIFNKKNSAEIQKSKIAYQKEALLIQKNIKDLTAKINYINSALKELKKELLLTKNSITIKEELLKSAKKAYILGVMTVDEYLKYEDDLAEKNAKLANLIALKNSLIAQKAMIYGKNLKKVFK